MRLILSALAVVLLAGPALAQTTLTAPTTTAPTAPAVQPPTAPVAKPAPKPKRPTFDERFDSANITHDGKLTLDQAKKGKMRGVVKYFADIDIGKKGFISKADVETFR